MKTWAELCEDPLLQNLPYKIETNRFNQIVMSPASNWHGGFQSEIAHLLHGLMQGGRVITECAVETDDGVKVADVAWVTRERLAPHRRAINMPVAPEICVEIVSPGNSAEEMAEKQRLYFAKGASEVWFCNDSGQMKFFAAGQPEALIHSGLCPEFPLVIDWD